MSVRNFIKLIIAVGVSELAGVIGALFTVQQSSPQATPAIASGWYAALIKPTFSPPSWVFGPVWVTLYALMGVALFLVWEKHSHILENVRMLRVWKIGIFVFFTQLFLNAAWSIIFFGLRSPGWALLDIAALWLAIVLTIVAFVRLSKPAAWLLVPYILWVGFAGYLNYSIWVLN